MIISRNSNNHPQVFRIDLDEDELRLLDLAVCMVDPIVTDLPIRTRQELASMGAELIRAVQELA